MATDQARPVSLAAAVSTAGLRWAFREYERHPSEENEDRIRDVMQLLREEQTQARIRYLEGELERVGRRR